MSIPNTLSILINTRIRGNSKIKYVPSMSIEGITSDKVYFDPLVKLNSSVVNYIPKGLPETERLTQFFNKNEFTSLIQRTLGNGAQPKRDLVESKKSGVVDNNIRITLDALFKSGEPFYLKGKRFTIYGYEWENGDWKIQSNKSEKMKSILRPYILQSPYMYPPYAYYPQYPNQIQRQRQRQRGGDPLENINIDPEALTGNVEPNMSRLETAALESGTSLITEKTDDSEKKIGGQRYSNSYDSNLAYYIVIDLELYPGETIPLQEKASLACQIRYEKIRKSYADIFGLIYQPKELRLPEDLNKNYIAAKNKTKKDNNSRQMNTRRRR